MENPRPPLPPFAAEGRHHQRQYGHQRARLDLSGLNGAELRDREQFCYQVMKSHGTPVYRVSPHPPPPLSSADASSYSSSSSSQANELRELRELRELYQYMLTRAERLSADPGNDALLAEVSSLLIRARRRWANLSSDDQKAALLRPSSSHPSSLFDTAMAKTASEGRIYYPEDVLLPPSSAEDRPEETILAAADLRAAERAVARQWPPPPLLASSSSAASAASAVSVPSPEGRVAIAALTRRLQQIETIARRGARQSSVSQDLLFQQIGHAVEDAVAELRALSDQRDIETIRGEEVVRRLREAQKDARAAASASRMGGGREEARRLELLAARTREKDGVIEGLLERNREYVAANEELREAVEELRGANAALRDSLAAAKASAASSLRQRLNGSGNSGGGLHLAPEKVSELGRAFQGSRAKVDKIINAYNASVADKRARDSSHKIYEGVLDETGRLESTSFLDSNLSYIAPSSFSGPSSGQRRRDQRRRDQPRRGGGSEDFFPYSSDAAATEDDEEDEGEGAAAAYIPTANDYSSSDGRFRINRG